MVTYSYVELKMPEAQDLADLRGVQADLERTKEFAQMLIEISNKEKPDYRLIEALTIAATVSYARAFSGGIRRHLGEVELSILSKEQRSTHEYFRAYRDKHVAHSVNEFEENHARAQYCEERVYEEGFTTISYSSARVLGISAIDAEALIELCDALGQEVEKCIEHEKIKLLSLIQSKPVDSILALGRSTFNPNFANASKPRKRHK